MTDYEKYHNLAVNALDKFYTTRIIAENDKTHVINIDLSIMMHRDGIQTGGGFVTSLCANDLDQTVSRADSVCVQHLPFFLNCLKFIHAWKS
jgi:hypothetical protein